MKTQKYFSLLSFALVLCFLLSVVSCDDDTSDYGIADQLFRPINFQAEVDDEIGNAVNFSWVPIKGTSYYSLEISRDSLQFKQDLQSFSIYDDDKFEIENLWSDSRYSARIKAISIDSKIKDSEYKQITFVTD
ncbi:MAG: hypothetical protein A2W90_01620 [Bacteroidetes bacterium GWF2_42_66]|nr:MAG: hypothetical protein A2W92_11925 [Bacteroidetes bacterium GWA2_42_15]OFY01066.1 MAG: hypothetical protein A2W89_15105 [Bacteroidetes bacterium GWE2_42_39]OFY41909.1 MAG: hypothetical protein A2W90_01620 [Bacteroidetes bacterium GWF2_42_66]HBL77909.1 hypothetical protein [Prolixibacteraceae bacterium]HCU63390.1 hypothetical protein [Prolixibacteraceae bacterium]